MGIIIDNSAAQAGAGIVAGAALFHFVMRIAPSVARWIASKTKTKADDKVVAKGEKVLAWLNEHPEVLDVAHSVIDAVHPTAAPHDIKSEVTPIGKKKR